MYTHNKVLLGPLNESNVAGLAAYRFVTIVGVDVRVSCAWQREIYPSNVVGDMRWHDDWWRPARRQHCHRHRHSTVLTGRTWRADWRPDSGALALLGAASLADSQVQNVAVFMTNIQRPKCQSSSSVVVLDVASAGNTSPFSSSQCRVSICTPSARAVRCTPAPPLEQYDYVLSWYSACMLSLSVVQAMLAVAAVMANLPNSYVPS